MESVNRKQLIGLAVALVVVLLMIEAWVAPPAHEIHSIGGTPLGAAAYTPPGGQDINLYWRAGPPSESLSNIQCGYYRAPHPACSSGDVADQFPTLKQSDHTLYYVWTGCVDWSGAGPIIPWAGQSIEYFASTRTLVLHCYIGTGLLYFPERLFGTAGERTETLLAIPTSSMGRGTLRIDEDDRLEHLIGDTSTEFQLATATIS